MEHLVHTGLRVPRTTGQKPTWLGRLWDKPGTFPSSDMGKHQVCSPYSLCVLSHHMERAQREEEAAGREEKQIALGGEKKHHSP